MVVAFLLLMQYKLGVDVWNNRKEDNMRRIFIIFAMFTAFMAAGCSGGSDADTASSNATASAKTPAVQQLSEPEEPDFSGITREEITNVAYVGFTTDKSLAVYYYNSKGNVIKSDYTFSYNSPNVPGEQFLADYDSLLENIAGLYGEPDQNMDIMVMIALPEEIMNDKAKLILGNYLRMGSRWDNPENVIVTGMYFDRDRESVVITVKVENKAYVEYFRELEIKAGEMEEAVSEATE